MQEGGRILRNPRHMGLLSAAGAVMLGICYLAAAGAPARMMAVNVAAFLVGLAAYATLRLPRWRSDAAGRLALPAMGALLLIATFLGNPVEGAARWVALGPLNLQVSFMLLPPMLVWFAREQGMSGAIGVTLAGIALALQPDRAMAGVLVTGLGVLALRRGEWQVRVALTAAAAAFGAALLQPDNLPAVPFVDQILYTSFSVHPLAGAAVVGGACLLLAPALASLSGGEALRTPGLVFGAAWATIILAAALGNYPTPLVGYGGSAILGYLLSVALLPARSLAASEAGLPAAGGQAPPEEPMLRAGLA